MQKRIWDFSHLALATGIAVAAASAAGAATLPSVVINSIELGEANVCTGTGSFEVKANVLPSYRTALASTDNTVVTKCIAGTTGAGNNNCGTGNTAILCSTVRTQVSYTVEKQVSAKVSDGYTNNLALAGPSPAGGDFSGLLAEPSGVSDGKKTVTVTASVQDDMVGDITKTTRYFPTYNSAGGGSCSGTQVGTDVVEYPADTHDVRTGADDDTGTYILDINPPDLDIKNVSTDPISQDADQTVHTQIKDGSTAQDYLLTDTVTHTGGTSYSVASGLTPPLNFGDNGNKDGKASPANDDLAVHIPACAPTGTYTVSSRLRTGNICGNASAYDVAASNNDSISFEVTGTSGGIALHVQTGVVSVLLPAGGYGIAECFVSTDTTQKRKIIINNNPGTVHITSIINLADTCGGGTVDPAVKYTPASVVLTVPEGFSFSDTGRSPRAHVFIGPADPGFDLHYPSSDPNWTEITDLVRQINGASTDTIDFATAAFKAAYPDGVSGDQTIYIRAHAQYSRTDAAAGSPETFVFGSQATGTDSDGNDLDSGLETYDLIANPTSEQCVDGTLVP